MPAGQSVSEVQAAGQPPETPSQRMLDGQTGLPTEACDTAVQMPSAEAPRAAEHTSHAPLQSLPQQTPSEHG